MKTFCLTLGLLLIFCCCNAIPIAMQHNTAPGNCCFRFSTSKIPLQRVTNIIKTHKSCLKKGFIVSTVLKKQICYASNFDWAQKIYNQVYNNEGSSFP